VAKLEMRHPAARRGSRGHLARARAPPPRVSLPVQPLPASLLLQLRRRRESAARAGGWWLRGAPATPPAAAMCAASEQRSYAAACEALTALITAHYRPTGYDAAATFGKLREWLQARHFASTWCVVRLTSHCRAQLLELEDAVNKLSVVHVAGTKGKVSRAPLLRRLPAPC